MLPIRSMTPVERPPGAFPIPGKVICVVSRSRAGGPVPRRPLARCQSLKGKVEGSKHF
jgi:hypothetical protein